MEKLNSIYPEVSFIIEQFAGLSNTSKPYQRLIDHIYRNLTWKQFNKMQAMRTRLEFLSQSEFESITGSKSLLKNWIELRSRALEFYKSFEQDALIEIEERKKEAQKIMEMEAEDVVEIGFDLTEVDLIKFLELFNDFHLQQPYRDEKRLCYVFTSYLTDLIELRTGAHPICKGLMFNTTQGYRGDGYCSYIGAKGPKSFIEALKKLVLSEGDTKGYSNTPDFI